MSSLYEHFRLRENEIRNDNGQLYFNRRLLGNIPFRGNGLPALKQDEYDELETLAEGRVRVFDLSDPNQLTEYETIVHRIVSGAYAKVYQERNWVPEKQNYVVLLEYAELVKVLPPHLKDAIEHPARGRTL